MINSVLFYVPSEKPILEKTVLIGDDFKRQLVLNFFLCAL